ncbi:MAG: DnaD domain protein [Clostridia bacterium]|nr:DnaD domain protein [Clostridia bacterium]
MSISKSSFRIKNKLMSDTFVLPKKLLARLSEAGEGELKIFIVLSSLELGEDYISEEELFEKVRDFGLTESDFSEGLAFLRGAGLIEKPSSRKSEKADLSAHVPARPSYKAQELADVSEKGEFKELYEYASRRLGKSLNQSDIATLYSFHEYLCMPYDVIMLTIEHCASEGKGSLRYVEKLLMDFADKDINTYEKAEEYIMNRKKYLGFEGKIRDLFGLGKRALTQKEKVFVSSWQAMGFSWDMITHAFERTVEGTKSQPNMSYMNKILENWKSSGFESVGEVETGDKKPSVISDGFDPDEFFKAALEKAKNR